MRTIEVKAAVTVFVVVVAACGRESATLVAKTDSPAPTGSAPTDVAPVDPATNAGEHAPSCERGGPGAGNDCGLSGDTACCASSEIPGGAFFRWKNGAAPDPQDEFPATVGGFALDLFEVTVGRFRAFVEAGGGTRVHGPKEGSGAHPKIPGSGWKSAYNGFLPEDRVALDEELTHAKPVTLWTQGAGPHENRPMKGLSWAMAFAFCAWDGGRLPTAAEWNFAAMGGTEYRTFPWGNKIGHSRAVYDCRDLGESKPSTVGCDPKDVLPVGSKPSGKGRWGQFDLVGSVAEWALDSDDQLLPCKDCGIVDPTAWALAMGGSFWDPDISSVTSSSVVHVEEPVADFSRGVRCARDLPGAAP